MERQTEAAAIVFQKFNFQLLELDPQAHAAEQELASCGQFSVAILQLVRQMKNFGIIFRCGKLLIKFQPLIGIGQIFFRQIGR